MGEQKDSWLLTQERERWTIRQTQVLESGPERAALWVRFAGRRSQLDLTFLLARDARHIDVRARVLFADRSARLKLVLPSGGAAEFEVPGGTALRRPCGEVPGGRWVRAGIHKQAASRAGFASDALYGFDTTDGEFRATIVRASRYGGDVTRGPDDSPWLPAVDAGELRFNFLLTPDFKELPQLAALLEEPLVTLPVPAGPGALPPAGQWLDDLPPALTLLSLRTLPDASLELRLQNTGARQTASITWLGQRVSLGPIAPGEIATWRLAKNIASGSRWLARRHQATSLA